MSIAGRISGLFGRDGKAGGDDPIPDDLPGLEGYLVTFMTRRLKLPPGATITRATVLTELGQDSLSLIRISGELEEKLAIEIEPALVFEAPTLGDLAAILHRIRAEAPPVEPAQQAAE